MTVHTDTVIIGAGPSGLFQYFELGLLGIDAHIVDSLPVIGGQCAMLYPDKAIYDIPALPIVGAQELIDRLAEQLQPFDPTYHLGQRVIELVVQADGAFELRTETGTIPARSSLLPGSVPLNPGRCDWQALKRLRAPTSIITSQINSTSVTRKS